MFKNFFKTKRKIPNPKILVRLKSHLVHSELIEKQIIFIKNQFAKMESCITQKRRQKLSNLIKKKQVGMVHTG